MDFNFFNILIISGVIHGGIFSFFILYNKKYRTKSSPYLAFVVLFLSLHNLYYWIGDVGLDAKIPYYDNIYIPWNLLILPFYYFFVQEYFQVQKKDRYYYLAPFFISLSIHFSLLIDTYFFNDVIALSYSSFEIIFYYTEEYFSLTFTVFVIIKTFYLIKQKEKELLKSKATFSIETRWLKKLLWSGIFISFLWLLLTGYSQIKETGQFNTQFKYFLWLSISILIYWLGYLGVYHGLIFSQRVSLQKRVNKEKLNISLEKNPRVEKIKELIEHEKLFLDSSLSIKKISIRLELNENYFSRIFNQHSSESFLTYLNKLRVSEAKKLLIDDEYKNYTIVAIGLESGFNSKSVFYKVFKEETGLTPSEYKKNKMS